MKIEKAGYSLEYQAILFIVIAGNERFVCCVTPQQLDSDNWFSLSETRMLELFQEREKDIIEAAAITIEEARRRKIKHEPGVRNEPLLVALAY